MGSEGIHLIELGKGKAALQDGAGLRRSAASPIRRHCRLVTCCSICCALVILTIVIVIILAFTLLKPKNPHIYVDNVTLDSFKVSVVLNIPPTLSLNATLGLDISIYNPNRASLKHTNSTSQLFYRDVEVGSIPVPAGHIGAHGTELVSSTLDLMVDRIITNPDLPSDVNEGSLPFSASTRISGRVNVLSIFKHHFDASSLCSFIIFTSNSSASAMACKYDIRL